MRKFAFIILSVVLTSCFAPGNSKHSVQRGQATHAFTFREIKLNETDLNTRNILIVGAGSMEGRMFLDNLSNTLNALLRALNVGSVYFFLGNDEADISHELNRLTKDQRFDVLIQFEPGSGYGRTGANSRTHSSVKYRDNFQVLAFDHGNLQQPLWKADLHLNFTATQQSGYRNLSNTIIQSLQENRIIKKVY